MYDVRASNVSKNGVESVPDWLNRKQVIFQYCHDCKSYFISIDEHGPLDSVHVLLNGSGEQTPAAEHQVFAVDKRLDWVVGESDL